MSKDLLDSSERRQPSHPHQVRLPAFISEEKIGLGDVVKRATNALGVSPCGGCERRAATLNRWMVFSGYEKGIL